jgi:hypothetical protein
MDFSDIKNWVSDPSERFIVIEDGKPQFVILSFDAYKNLKGERTSPFSIGQHNRRSTDRPRVENDVNEELEAERIRMMQQDLIAKMSMHEDETESIPHIPRDPSEIRLEDLPL